MKTFYYYQITPKNQAPTTVFVSQSEIEHIYDGDIKNHPQYSKMKSIKARGINDAMLKLADSE